MKKLLSILIVLASNFIYSQVETKTQKAIKVLEPQSFFLNGATKSQLGGSSRIGFKVDLPPNTVEWYYAFTTEPIKNDTQNLQLESQIGFLLNATGFSSNLIDLVKIPKGQGLIDVFLTDRNGYNLFFEKNLLGFWKYKAPNSTIEGSITNVKEGKIKIDDVVKGSHFIVIRNTSLYEGMNVKLEVVAIVEEISTDLSKWKKESKDIVFNDLKTDLKKIYPNFDNDKIEEISGCVVSNLTEKFKPDDLAKLATYELKALLKKNIKECANN